MRNFEGLQLYWIFHRRAFLTLRRAVIQNNLQVGKKGILRSFLITIRYINNIQKTQVRK